VSATIINIETLMSQGRYFEARLTAESAIKESDDIRFKLLLALALAKSGMPERAKDILEPVYAANMNDPETAGILGGIYKRLFKKNQDNKYAVLARNTYQQNFSITKHYYTGINAAAMALISGHGSACRQIAAELTATLNPASTDFWEMATLGEAWLLSKDKQKATTQYLQARKIAGTEWGKVQSTYDQLMLLNFFTTVPAEILKAFAPPGIIAFTGHMIDHPERSTPRFPADIEAGIKEGIMGAIRTTRASIGYTSLSCGADILFAEAMADLGGEVNIFLPFNREDYIRESVAFAGDHWVERFERLEKMFPVNYVTHDRYDRHDDLFSFQNRIILGSAALRATMNFTTPTLLTVLSETDMKRKEGGTRDTIALWPFPDRWINVNPDRLLPIVNTTVNKNEYRPLPLDRSGTRHILYLILADLPGASAYEKETYWKALKEIQDHLLLKPELSFVDEQMVVAFRQPNSAMELVKGFAGYKKLVGSNQAPRISLHAGSFDIEDGRIGSDRKAALADLHSATPPGVISAYGRFAAATTLISESWILDFAGVVSTDGPDTDVYSLNFKK
jgi:MAP3K TRAFs-binding domain